jgi:alpha-L-fucosidase
VIRLQEPIANGQSVSAYQVEVSDGGDFRVVSRGTTIGYKKLDRVGPVPALNVKVSILETRRQLPQISVGIY